MEWSNFLWRAIGPPVLIYAQGFMARGYRWILLLIVTQWGWCDALAGTGTKLRFELAEDDRVVDTSKDSGLRELVSLADEMIRRSQAEETALHESRKKLLRDRDLRELSYLELKQYFSEPKDFISDKDHRGWKEIRSLALKALAPGEPALRRHYHWQIQEIATAINNNHRSPSPPYMDLLQPPLFYMDYAHNPIAKGERIASNLKLGLAGRPAPAGSPIAPSAASQLNNDPLPSTFWLRPQDIRRQDLYHGFGRAQMPDFESKLWTYAAPKTSYGGCPGFEAQAGTERIKVKFAETTSEPFTARIFWALGYHVEPTDYVHSLRLKYDRRFFREFHLRKDVQMKVRALFIPLHTVNLQQLHDPFDYIFVAVLKNGERISGRDLKHRLLHDPNIGPHASGPENFRTEFERQIDHLVTTPANVQAREPDVKTIGPWDFASLDHADRREIRAAGLLGAWVGWFDSRFENTRLKIVQTPTPIGRDGPANAGSPSAPQLSTNLRHYFTDLGGGLGKSVGVLSRHCECPNHFTWRFTGPQELNPLPRTRHPQPLTTMAPRGRHANGFRIVDYEPIEDTEAFSQMTVEDARWMARLIAQLTEDQIIQALIASGFDAAEVKIYTEKLASRRDWMLRDLGLQTEFAMLRPRGPDMTLTYNPHREPLPAARLRDGTRVAARASLMVIENGRLLPNHHTRSPLQRLAADQVPPTRDVASTERDEIANRRP